MVAAFLIGGAIGQRNLTNAQMGNGQSGQGTSAFQKAFPYHNSEEVLLQARETAATDASLYTSAASDLVGRLRALATVANIQSPLPIAGVGLSPTLRSADGRSMLVTFEVAGDSNQAQRNVEGPLAAVRGLSPDALEYEGSAVPLRDVWVALRSAVRSVLEHVTLADVASGKLPPHVAKLTRESDAWVRRSR